MDRTTLYREIVRLAHPHDAIDPPRQVDDDIVTVQASEIARSLARLDQHLRDIRPTYLSTTAPQKLSEKDKDEIDYDVHVILQTENRKIKALEKSSQQQEGASKPRNWFLSDPQKEGERETKYLHHQGMFIGLNNMLKHCSEEFQAIQKVRVSRRVAKRHVFATASGTAAGSSSASAAPGSTNGLQVPASFTEPAFTQEQQQMLVQENDAVLQDLNAALNQTHVIEKSMTEVAQLQSELSTHLTAQTEQINRMMDEAFKTSGDVDGANLQLKKAQSRNKRASKMIIYSSVGVGCLLLFYDWAL